MNPELITRRRLFMESLIMRLAEKQEEERQKVMEKIVPRPASLHTVCFTCRPLNCTELTVEATISGIHEDDLHIRIITELGEDGEEEKYLFHTTSGNGYVDPYFLNTYLSKDTLVRCFNTIGLYSGCGRVRPLDDSYW